MTLEILSGRSTFDHIIYRLISLKQSLGRRRPSYYVRGGLKAMGLRNLVDTVMPFFFVYKRVFGQPYWIGSKGPRLAKYAGLECNGKEGLCNCAN